MSNAEKKTQDAPVMASDDLAIPGSAIASFVLGVLGVLLIGAGVAAVLLGIAGIATAVHARGLIKESSRPGTASSLLGFILSLAATGGGLLSTMG